MARDTGLMNPGFADDVVDLVFTVAQRLDDVAPRFIGERLKGVKMHCYVYT